ncbi:MOSC N-terminal beta barrel domain-containing protein [Acinetobacter sp. NIPH 2699]|uniref:MOSC domain-containing protein n=1 Tax=Acinetobacter sp. NIPH 2699 TaxID=2923433 RepID=UPI001F4A6EF2|nr:MOSC N-terminal beta barrel domain-containing protein [Acinetobacter sp. NIPH 2699]MCH7337471.1 MOSC domain-containing protein [Acinetobacter sp. NIPH 2699]
MRISQLFHYPVKSCRANKCFEMEIDSFGPKWDRRWMIVDKDGRFITQRQVAKMGQIGVTISSDVVRFDYQSEQIELSLTEAQGQADDRLVSVWQDQLKGNCIEHAVNDWLSLILERHVRLIYMPQETIRQVDLDYAQVGDRVGFADGFPFLIISEASVDFLSDKVGYRLDVQRFRPNIVISGCDAFAEDQWKQIQIGEVKFDLVKPCSRCVIPTIDLETSQKQPEVMQAMLAYRKQGNKVMMGQNALHRGEGTIALGQEVQIIKTV